MNHPPACSFCSKAQARVQNLIAGPAGADVYICDECVRLCSDMIEMNKVERGHPEQDSEPVPQQKIGGWRGYSSSNPIPLSVALKMIKRQLDEMSKRVEVLVERAENEPTAGS